jgi:hypothetical protein
MNKGGNSLMLRGKMEVNLQRQITAAKRLTSKCYRTSFSLVRYLRLCLCEKVIDFENNNRGEDFILV